MPAVQLAGPWGDINAPPDHLAVCRSVAVVRRNRVRARQPVPQSRAVRPDGLRGRNVSPETAPAMAEVRDKGVNFSNSHSLFPTFTTANASGLATGHISAIPAISATRSIPVIRSGRRDGTVTPFLETDPSSRRRRAFRRRLSERGDAAEKARARGYRRQRSASSVRR